MLTIQYKNKAQAAYYLAIFTAGLNSMLALPGQLLASKLTVITKNDAVQYQRIGTESRCTSWY